MILSFLNKLNTKEIPYVSWKNNHEIDKVIEGKSDLDIYIPQEYKEQFFDLCVEGKWISVINPVANYPEIYHFYRFDRTLKIYHLHVYLRIITGESWLKEYDFPIGAFLIENRIKHASGIYILNNKAQSFLFALRHFTKGASYFSRLLYTNEIHSYQREWELCKESFQPDGYSKFIDFTPFLAESRLLDEFSVSNRSIAIQVRKELEAYLRLPKQKLNWLRLKSFKDRIFNKFFFKKKKILPHQGFILAFSGADGVGKSTMSMSIARAYGQFLTVKKVWLGRPQGLFVERLRKLMSKRKKRSAKDESAIGGNGSVGFKKIISVIFLAYLRFKESRKAFRYKQKGYLVFADRWPTLEYGKMDGPQLIPEDLKGFKKLIALLEKKYYDKIIEADLCIVLTVPVEVAIQRNKDRTKDGKETDEEIRKRHKENAEHLPKTKGIIRFDNNGELEKKCLELVDIIQQNLNQE